MFYHYSIRWFISISRWLRKLLQFRWWRLIFISCLWLILKKWSPKSKSSNNFIIRHLVLIFIEKKKNLLFMLQQYDLFCFFFSKPTIISEFLQLMYLYHRIVIFVVKVCVALLGFHKHIQIHLVSAAVVAFVIWAGLLFFGFVTDFGNH